jgi:hypothetical protein
MKVGFRTIQEAQGKPEGWVTYDEQDHSLTVVGDPSGRLALYLTTPRDFTIPESQRIDDFRIDRARPTENRTYMELALCEAFAEAGFWIMWETEEETT